jgi:hypothetical protein
VPAKDIQKDENRGGQNVGESGGTRASSTPREFSVILHENRAGESFVWTSTPRFLYLCRWKQFPVKIYRLDILTGQGQFFTEMTPPDIAGLRNISFIHFSSDGRVYVYSYSRLFSELYLVKGLK